jgi:hypothetical protein
MGEIIAAHAVLLLEVTDDGLDGGPSFELALDLWRDVALVAGGVDLELVIGRGVVAAIATVGDAAIEHVADERFIYGMTAASAFADALDLRSMQGNKPCGRTGGGLVPARGERGESGRRSVSCKPSCKLLLARLNWCAWA